MKKIIVLTFLVILSGCFFHKHYKDGVKSKEQPYRSLPVGPIERPKEDMIFPVFPVLPSEVLPDNNPEPPPEETSRWWFSCKT